MVNAKLPSNFKELESIDQLYSAMHALPEFTNPVCGKSFEGFLQAIDILAKLKSVEKYKIVFIGEPGKGKTTTICNWLGLMKQDICKAKNLSSVFLLATASGRTTVAEVHIRQVTSESKLRIEYQSIERQEEYIKEFCKYYYTKGMDVKDETADNEAENEGEDSSVHIEIDRVIRNMAGLERLPSGTDEKIKQRKEEIRQVLSQFADYEDFYEATLEAIDLEGRDCSEIAYDGKESYESWLSKVFKDINEGKRSDCAIPQKIYVDVNIADLDMFLPDYVDEVIDTIGLDSAVRLDLQEHLLADDTICFLIDDLRNVPSQNVKKLLSDTFLTELDRYAKMKTSIFVKAIESELVNVNEAEGDPDVGRDIKASEIDRKIDAEKVPYNTENMLFADSCAAFNYKFDKHVDIDPITKQKRTKKIKVISDYDEDIALEFKVEVNTKIESMIDKLRATLLVEAEGISKGVEDLLKQEQSYVNNNTKSALIEACTTLEIFKMGKNSFRGQAVQKAILKKVIDDLPWQTIRAMNRRYGGYKRWRIDIYTQIQQVGRNSFTGEIKGLTAKINEIAANMDDDNARSIFAGYVHQYEIKVKNSTEKTGVYFMKWALEECFAPQSDANPFWQKVINIRGRGYKMMVRECYEDIIYDDCGKLAKYVNTEVERILKQLIDSFQQSIDEC